MKEAIKKVYYCDTCKKKTFVKKLMEKHETFCMGNPANVPMCFKNCKHIDKNGSSFRCDKIERQMHTKGAVVNGLTEKYYEDFLGSVLMPFECGFYEEYDIHAEFSELFETP